MMTAEQLRELVDDAIIKALQQYVASQPDPFRALKARDMAARLSISESQLTNLVREGCPFIPVGAVGRRYDPAEVLAWLRRDYKHESARQLAGEPAPAPMKAARHPLRRRSAPTAA